MTKTKPDFTLNRPGALIAALPAILGFVPEKSLILVSIDGGELGAVLRVDLSAQVADGVGRLAEIAAAAAPASAIAVVVDADGAGCPVCTDEHRELCTVLTEALAAHGIELLAAHVVDRVAAGGRWHCADGCGASGAVDDPEASPLAVAAVLEGRRLYAHRADLQALIDPGDPECGAAVAAAIEQCAATHAAARRQNPRGQAQRDVEQLLTAATEFADGRPPTVPELAALGCTLSDLTVRDTVCALAIGENAAEAENLWALLVRSLPQPWRSEALVLLAFSAYARGDGPLAGLSLEAALRATPEHRMAGLLDTALQSGLRPDRIRGLAETGYRLAHELGVTLPQRRRFGRRAG